MTASHDPDRLIRAFLEVGDEQLRDPIYDAIRAQIEQQRQRAYVGPWRLPDMNKIATIGLATAAVIVLAFVGVQLFGSPTSGVGADPTSSSEPATPVPTPSVVPTATPAAGLPEGAFAFDDPETGMQIAVDIPASGWRFNSEFSALGKGEDADPPEAAALVWAKPPGTTFYVYGDSCAWRSTEPETPLTTVDEIVSALAAQTPRDASEPVDVTIGGYTGKTVTLHVPEDADFASCDGGEFGTWGLEPGVQDRYQQGPGQIDEVTFLDAGGYIVVLDASYRPSTSPELLEELRSVVESATFELP